ncbi:MAG: cell division protein ZapA [Myxococcales bacterium]|nr:cell division protein ZapA [Myxococcales bacterium]
MSRVRSIAVNIQGRSYKIRSDEDPAFLERVAAHVDETMERVGGRSGVVDSLDVAMLTAINLAREALSAQAGAVPDNPARLRALIERAESALDAEARGASPRGR